MQRIHTFRQVEHRLVSIDLGVPAIQTMLVVCLELFLVFGTTELVFVALQ